MNRALFSVLGVTLMLWGCPEKKVEAPAKPAEPARPANPPQPPAEAQPRADKECAAPLDPGPASDVTVGTRTAKASGSKLTFADKDADGAFSLGVLGPMNEDSGENMLALKKYLKFFADEKVDAIVFPGDVGEVADGIARVLKTAAAEMKVPVLVVIGNSECRAEYTDGVDLAKKDASNIVNLNAYRVLEFPEVTVVSLPGYHDPNFMRCQTGCRYFKSTVDEVISASKASKAPVVLISHGPPHGTGNAALDFSSAGDINAGDAEVNRAIKEGNVAFGLFSNIKESGGRGTAEAEGTTQVKEGAWSKTLFLAAGPADTMKWSMNDGTTSYGMAQVLTVKDGQASFKVLRNKQMSASEKAEAAKLAPPKREEVAAPENAKAPEKK
ncbi:MAG: metallophosphoesterase [Archangiaceae bacterium]|nr:metallophosphoesterase [Archangiaceae bacterium]